MKNDTIALSFNEKQYAVPIRNIHTLIIGSGAAGLNAAIQLNKSGVSDILVVTEGLTKGTSINTGSDKQTYYKLGIYGDEKDSPKSLAESFFNGGGMHGDIALVEASLSLQAFFNLVQLGVPFPHDKFGQFVGYKTDHDPLQRATSVGPYTSKMMCEKLIDELKRQDIPYLENRHIISLLISGEGDEKRCVGAIAVNSENDSIEESFEVFISDNIIFATGGPGGLYKQSVYPNVHTGGIGLALLAGAKAQNLPEFQYGLASIQFRWNVSGSYMQVLPKFISTASDGVSDKQEFLRPYFKSEVEMNNRIFLKGYQWPFDIRKIKGGSSLVDILVYIETEIKGRRVFLDYRECDSFSLQELDDDVYSYLENSKCLASTPLERLRQLNPDAIHLYEEHGIHLVAEPLEVAVCTQHNNGGLSGNIWWESTTIKHLFPIGEVNGTHGIYRPGGSALNSGQVGGIRAATYIANVYNEASVDYEQSKSKAKRSLFGFYSWLDLSKKAPCNWQQEREIFQERMSIYGGPIRDVTELEKGVLEAKNQWMRISEMGCSYDTVADAIEALRNIQLCFSHYLYLEAMSTAIASGVGSRGSALVIGTGCESVHPKLGETWNYSQENIDFNESILETTFTGGGINEEWVTRRKIPSPNGWFETSWAEFRNKEIYK